LEALFQVGDVGRENFLKQFFPRFCQHDLKAASVFRGHFPAHQPFLFQAIHNAGQCPFGHQRFLGQDIHGHPRGIAKGNQHIELGGRQPHLPNVNPGVIFKSLVGPRQIPQQPQKRLTGRQYRPPQRNRVLRLENLVALEKGGWRGVSGSGHG
jgi:hypothetical protein